MIDLGVDNEGHSLRHLVWRGLRDYPTVAVFQFLEDRDVIVRSEAARRLQLRPNRRVFERAVQLLTNKIAYKREIGAFLLGQLGTPKRPYKKESTKVLLQLLESERNLTVRATIISSLGQLKAYEALTRVVTFAKDRSPRVRESVAFAIGMIYCEQSKEIPLRFQNLLRVLRVDKSRLVREQAMLALELIQGEKEMEKKGTGSINSIDKWGRA